MTSTRSSPASSASGTTERLAQRDAPVGNPLIDDESFWGIQSF